MNISYPATYTVQPTGRVVATVKPPGSKSITNRALMLCALAQGDSTLTAPLHSDDTEAMIDCLRGLGVTIESDDGEIRISATGALHGNGAVLNARGSGTSADRKAHV